MKDFLDNLIAPDQKSEAWHDERVGRFTSSEIHKLMNPAMRDMTEDELKARPKSGKGSRTMTIEEPTLLSPGAMTYVRAKAAEKLTGSRETVVAPALDWGIMNEPKARYAFIERTGANVKEVGFISFSSFAGGSADGVLLDSEGVPNGVLEIKCPYYSGNHIENVTEIFSHDVVKQQIMLKDLHPEYYWQIQANMLWVARAYGVDIEEAKLVSYDPRFPAPIDMKFMTVTQNVDDQELMMTKLVVANAKLTEIMETLKM
jgi:hypothetical protein